MRNEGDVKKLVKDVLNTTDGCWWFMPPANGYGRSGIPDFVGCVHGMLFAVETKFGKGTTTAHQNREIEAITRAGGEVWIVRETNIDDWILTFKAWAVLNAPNT